MRKFAAILSTFVALGLHVPSICAAPEVVPVEALASVLAEHWEPHATLFREIPWHPSYPAYARRVIGKVQAAVETEILTTYGKDAVLHGPPHKTYQYLAAQLERIDELERLLAVVDKEPDTLSMVKGVLAGYRGIERDIIWRNTPTSTDNKVMYDTEALTEGYDLLGERVGMKARGEKLPHLPYAPKASQLAPVAADLWDIDADLLETEAGLVAFQKAVYNLQGKLALGYKPAEATASVVLRQRKLLGLLIKARRERQDPVAKERIKNRSRLNSAQNSEVFNRFKAFDKTAYDAAFMEKLKVYRLQLDEHLLEIAKTNPPRWVHRANNNQYAGERVMQKIEKVVSIQEDLKFFEPHHDIKSYRQILSMDLEELNENRILFKGLIRNANHGGLRQRASSLHRMFSGVYARKKPKPPPVVEPLVRRGPEVYVLALKHWVDPELEEMEGNWKANSRLGMNSDMFPVITLEAAQAHFKTLADDVPSDAQADFAKNMTRMARLVALRRNGKFIERVIKDADEMNLSLASMSLKKARMHVVEPPPERDQIDMVYHKRLEYAEEEIQEEQASRRLYRGRKGQDWTSDLTQHLAAGDKAAAISGLVDDYDSDLHKEPLATMAMRHLAANSSGSLKRKIIHGYQRIAGSDDAFCEKISKVKADRDRAVIHRNILALCGLPLLLFLGLLFASSRQSAHRLRVMQRVNLLREKRAPLKAVAKQFQVCEGLELGSVQRRAAEASLLEYVHQRTGSPEAQAEAAEQRAWLAERLY